MSQAEATRRQIADIEARIAERKAAGKPTFNLEQTLARWRNQLTFYEAETPAQFAALQTFEPTKKPVIEHVPLNFQQLIDMPFAEAEAYLYREVAAGRMTANELYITRDALFEYHDRLRAAAEDVAAAAARVREQGERLQVVEADIRATGIQPVVSVDIIEEQPYVPRPGLELKLSGAIRGILFLSVLAWTIGAAKGK